jgi:hypothetical protein
MHGSQRQAVGAVESPLEMATPAEYPTSRSGRQTWWEATLGRYAEAAEILEAFTEGFTFDFSLTIHTEVRKHGTKAK